MSSRTGIVTDRREALLSASERAALRDARRGLAHVRVQGAPDDIFRAIQSCVPVDGGLVGTLGMDAPSSPVSHVVKLPAHVIEGWASTPREQLQRMLAPMVAAGPGVLVSDSEAIVGSFREEVELLQRLSDAGLGESAGYKVSTRRVASGRVVHDFMTFALPRGRAFMERDRVALALLQPAIQSALARLGVPLIASQSILSQIVDEQSIGFMCLSREERIVEVNQKMHALVTRYLRAARVEGGRGALARFAARTLGETTGSRMWQIRHEDGRSLAEVSGHRLPKETHSIGEDLFLIMMREILLAPPREVFTTSGAMTERRWEIARLLVETGDSYKQIAGTLGIKDGTMRKHVEHVYRALGVQSRAELSRKLR